ncbi:MAG: RNB domain-containing ribonuclease [Novosphingobium sp.]|jgi:exoribonuclease R
MRILRDPDCLLAEGLATLRMQFQVPAGFPPPVLAAAEIAARRPPTEHADWTARAFVTLDPAGATDLDQAFAIEPAGSDWLLHYAIADVGWFVGHGDPLDAEAWSRGVTTYLPDGKAGLYPPVLAEGAASLLPDGPRPAVIFTVRVGPAGETVLDGVTRAVIRSRAKLAYETVEDADLPPGLIEIAERIELAEAQRGAARVDPPEQQVERNGDGRFRLQFRPLLPSEKRNAALSLACNLAVAQLLLEHRTGLFRVMAGPDPAAEARLRQTAKAFGLVWPDQAPLAQFEKHLDPADPRDAAFMLAVRRAGRGASYAPYAAESLPWHAAMAAPYAHATAPLRRLADRYAVEAALALANGRPVPESIEAAFPALPAAMQRAEARAGQIERAVVDLAETAILADRTGELFDAVVTDLGDQGARIQLCDLPVVARTIAHGVVPGDRLRVRLTGAEPATRRLTFQRVE